MRKQREEKDFWDKHKDLQSKSSFNKSNFDKSSYNKQNFNKKSLKVDNKRGDNIQKKLEDNNEMVLLEVENLIFRPI